MSSKALDGAQPKPASTTDKMDTQPTLLDKMIDEFLLPGDVKGLSTRSPPRSFAEHSMPSSNQKQPQPQPGAQSPKQTQQQTQQQQQQQPEPPPPQQNQQLEGSKATQKIKNQMDDLKSEMEEMKGQMDGIASKIDVMHAGIEQILALLTNKLAVQAQSNGLEKFRSSFKSVLVGSNSKRSLVQPVEQATEPALPMLQQPTLVSRTESASTSQQPTLVSRTASASTSQQPTLVSRTASTSMPPSNSQPQEPTTSQSPPVGVEPFKQELLRVAQSTVFIKEQPSNPASSVLHHQSSGRSINKVQPSNNTISGSNSSFNSQRTDMGPSRETFAKTELPPSLVSEGFFAKPMRVTGKKNGIVNNPSALSGTERGWQQPNEEQYIRQIALESFLSRNSNQSKTSSVKRARLLKTVGLMALHRQDSFSSSLSVEEKRPRFCLHHESLQRVVLDVFVMFFVLMDAIMTPLALSFDVDNTNIKLLDTVGTIVYIMDFCSNFLTTYSSDRGALLITDLRLTARNYLKSRWIVFDVLSCFPWEDFLPNPFVGRCLGVAKCVRLIQIPSLTRKIFPLGTGILSIFGLLGVVFLVSHINGCVWNWLGEEWRQGIPGYDDQSLFWRYSLCWSVAIGALNASPPNMNNPKEQITISLYMIMGNVIQATVFGSFAHLISSFNEQDDAYHRKLMFTHDRCRFLGIPDPLSKRIQLYYQNLYRETKSISANADEFINELSPALICDVKYQLYRDMLKQIPFLSSRRVDNSVVELLVMHLTSAIYMKDDVVARRGERGDWMGFIGAKGSVAVLENNHHTHRIRRVLRKGDYFGETALFHQQMKRESTIVALNWVQLHQLHRRDFETVKQSNPDQATILEEEMSKYMSSKVANRF